MQPDISVARNAVGASTSAPSGAPAAQPPSGPATEPFVPQKLEENGWFGWVWECLLSYPHRVMRFFRWLTPAVRIPLVPWVIVLRYEGVREVLSRDDDFPVAWGARMKEVTGGPQHGRNFVLGMANDDEYKLSYTQLAKAFKREDVRQHIAVPSAKYTRKILDKLKNAPERPIQFDAIQKLITAIPTKMCRDYYGLRIADEKLFAKATLAVSSYLFGPSSTREGTRLALAAAAVMRNTIRDSMASGRQDPEQGSVMQRFFEMGLPEDVIHAQLFGMVMGFIPTNVLAGGNILETLLRRPDFMVRARAAALADDDEMLWRCLREVLRFRHINPTPWRVCRRTVTIGAGGPEEFVVKRGKKVLTIIQSAMFDERCIDRPDVFDPERRDQDYMVFGFGQHWCIGAYIARAQITETFRLLLKEKNLHAVANPAVLTKRFNNLFPLHLTVGFNA